ncbi:MAG TPA: GNAT family N-acetyltransferase [Propionicimonas sp.]|nr:GNAT family N-acetyltransferase [Propionicimonas sp.]
MPRLSPLTVPEVLALPCPYCGRRLPEGTAWLSRAAERWQRCGVKVMSGETVVGVLAMAPGHPDGVAQIKMLWVSAEDTAAGLGRQLVQAAVAEAVRLHLSQIVAVGGRGQLTCATPPEGFLKANGFTQAPGESLWRLDVGQTVLERSGLGRFSRFLRAWGHAGPEPAGGAVSRRALRG